MVKHFLHNYELEVTEEFVGGVSIDKNGTPLTDKTLKKLSNSDAILLGAVGGPNGKVFPSKKDQRGTS